MLLSKLQAFKFLAISFMIRLDNRQSCIRNETKIKIILEYVLDINQKKYKYININTFIGKHKYRSMNLVNFKLVFMLSSSKIMARFDMEVNMLLILEKKLSTCSVTIFRMIFKNCVWHFFV